MKQFKTAPTKTDRGSDWFEAYVSFDDGETYYAIGGGEQQTEADKMIGYYKAHVS